MYKIRQAKATDYAAINKLNDVKVNMRLHEHDGTIEEDFYHDSLQNADSKWFLVEKSGEIKGFIFFTRHNEVLEIKKFTIHHNDRKKGLNEHLYQKLDQFATRNGVLLMKVFVSESHLDVIDFFERKGWEKENQGYVKYMK